MKLFQFGPVVQMSFKRYFILSPGSPNIPQSRTICAILVEGIMRNISENLF